MMSVLRHKKSTFFLVSRYDDNKSGLFILIKVAN